LPSGIAAQLQWMSRDRILVSSSALYAPNSLIQNPNFPLQHFHIDRTNPLPMNAQLAAHASMSLHSSASISVSSQLAEMFKEVPSPNGSTTSSDHDGPLVSDPQLIVPRTMADLPVPQVLSANSDISMLELYHASRGTRFTWPGSSTTSLCGRIHQVHATPVESCVILSLHANAAKFAHADGQKVQISTAVFDAKNRARITPYTRLPDVDSVLKFAILPSSAIEDCVLLFRVYSPLVGNFQQSLCYGLLRLSEQQVSWIRAKQTLNDASLLDLLVPADESNDVRGQYKPYEATLPIKAACSADQKFDGGLVAFPVTQTMLPHGRIPRNQVFVSVESVNFSNRSGTGSARNITVTCTLNKDPETVYSAVSYHNKKPDFGDEFVIDLPPQPGSDDRLEFRFYHVACKEGKEAPTGNLTSLVGTAYLPLSDVMDSHQKSHSLAVSSEGKMIDNGKPVLGVQTRYVSTLAPLDRSVGEVMHFAPLMLQRYLLDEVSVTKFEAVVEKIMKGSTRREDKLRNSLIEWFLQSEIDTSPVKDPVGYINLVLDEIVMYLRTEKNHNVLTHIWIYFDLFKRLLVENPMADAKAVHFDAFLSAVFECMQETNLQVFRAFWLHSMLFLSHELLIFVRDPVPVKGYISLILDELQWRIKTGQEHILMFDVLNVLADSDILLSLQCLDLLCEPCVAYLMNPDISMRTLSLTLLINVLSKLRSDSRYSDPEVSVHVLQLFHEPLFRKLLFVHEAWYALGAPTPRYVLVFMFFFRYVLHVSSAHVLLHLLCFPCVATLLRMCLLFSSKPRFLRKVEMANLCLFYC
jgi:hypothetical protein